MMMTLRVVAMCRPRLPDALDTRIDLEDAGKLAEVTDLVRRRRDPRRQRRGLGVDPRRLHPGPLGPEHVDLGSVADEERLLRADRETLERLVEDHPLRLPPPDRVRDDDGAAQLGHTRAPEDGEGRGRVAALRGDSAARVDVAVTG